MSTNCIPYPGELNDDWQPITATGKLFMPGPRSCNHKDCISPEHVGKSPEACQTQPCNQRPKFNGYCKPHFIEFRKLNGRLLNEQDVLNEIIVTWIPTEPMPTVCCYNNCPRPFKAKGLCKNHYMSWYQYQRRVAEKLQADLQ